MRLKSGDNVTVMAGRDRGKSGKIIQVFPALNKIVVEGINVRKRHLKPQKKGEKGQVVEFSAPIPASSASYLCQKCGKTARLGTSIVTEPTGKVKKLRVCKKCKEIVG